MTYYDDSSSYACCESLFVLFEAAVKYPPSFDSTTNMK